MINRNCLGSFSNPFFLCLIVAATLWPPSVSTADTFLWTGGAGNGDMFDEANWVNTTFGGEDFDDVPDNDDTIVFASDAAAFRGSARNLIVQSGVNLTLGQVGFSVTTIGGTITNNGDIGFLPDDVDDLGSTGTADQAISIGGGEVVLNGGGTIWFTDSESGIYGRGSGGVLTNVDNTIRGPGSIGRLDSNLVFNNQATLIVELGTLTFSNTVINNTGGLIEIASDGILSGRFTFSPRVISGGVIDGKAGSRLRSGTLQDLEITGLIEIGGGVVSAPVFQGTIMNTGEIGFQSDDFDDLSRTADQAIRINEEAVLIGGGTIRFTDSESGIYTDNITTAVLTNVDNVIRGPGTIGQFPRPFVLNNQGTLVAEHGTLTITSTAIDNTDGLIEIASDGMLTATSGAVISGGVIDGKVGSILRAGTLQDLEITGLIEIGGGAASVPVFQGAIMNTGEIGFQSDDFDDLRSRRADQGIGINEEAVLSGGGTIRFTDSESGIYGITAFPPSVLTNVDNVIRGPGSIGRLDLSFVFNNQGSLVAENGTLTFRQTTLDNTDGVISVILDGTDFAGSGNINFSGSLDLTGTLALVVGETLDVAVGDRFRILDATSLNGTEFESVNLDATGAYEFDVIYGTNFVDIEVLSFDPGSTTLLADVDLNGVVNFSDIPAFIDVLIGGGFQAEADCDENGVVDFDDIPTFIAILISS